MDLVVDFLQETYGKGLAIFPFFITGINYVEDSKDLII